MTQLVNLLGPVESVTAQTSRGFATRTVTSEPRRGEVIEVEVPTTVNGALAFANGANVGLTVSWDVWKHTRLPIELYGTEGTLLNPDPNFFGGTPRLSERNGDWQDLAIEAHPFGVANRELRSGAMVADYRIIGVLDMAQAIRRGPAASGERRSRAARARGAGSARALLGRGPEDPDRDHLRAAAAGRRSARDEAVFVTTASLCRSSTGGDEPAGLPVAGAGDRPLPGPRQIGMPSPRRGTARCPAPPAAG